MSMPQIICPDCHNRLNKPPQLELVGNIKEAGGSFMAFSNPDDKLTCPACGFQLRIGDIIEGKFDIPKEGWLSSVFSLVILGFLIWLITQCS